MNIKEIVYEGVDGSHLALGTDQWQSLINTNKF